MGRRATSTVLLTLVVTLLGCGRQASDATVEEIARFPLDSLEGVLTRSGIELDSEVTSDGNGSVRITASEPTVARLFEVADPGVENARLIYRARLRTEDVAGQVYLEMWCHFEGRGEYFSRGLHSPLSGSVDWTTQEIPFFLQAGQSPDLLKLNVVVTGPGSVWVDDIVVSKGPLE